MDETMTPVPSWPGSPERLNAGRLNGGAATTYKQAAVGLERALDNLLNACAKDKTCPIYNGGKPGEVLDRVLAELDRSPLSVPGAPGRPAVGQGVASWAMVNALYEQARWPDFENAIADAQRYLQEKVSELDNVCYAHEFGYWAKQGKKTAARRTLDSKK